MPEYLQTSLRVQPQSLPDQGEDNRPRLSQCSEWLTSGLSLARKINAWPGQSFLSGGRGRCLQSTGDTDPGWGGPGRHGEQERWRPRGNSGEHVHLRRRRTVHEAWEFNRTQLWKQQEGLIRMVSLRVKGHRHLKLQSRPTTMTHTHWLWYLGIHIL